MTATTHGATVINGREISKAIIGEITKEVNKLTSIHKRPPGLVTILVGDHPASVSYVTLKNKIAKEVGFHQIQDNQPNDISEEALLDLIDSYNRNDNIDGILVQLPLPGHIDTKKVTLAIDPQKDVDCFHPFNQGEFFSNYHDRQLVACTPAGIMELVRRMNISTKGKHVVIVGRSNLVGKPMLIMMLEKEFGGNASVTLVHSATPDLSVFTKQGDILIVAAGRANLVTGSMIKPGAIVIDVGVNRIGEKINSTGKTIAVLTGDVVYEEAKLVASYITPVPGGVGPMTIAMLMKNTLVAYLNRTQ